MRALHGQTVTQWPQETQLDSPIGRAAIPQNTRVLVFPANAEGFVHL